MTIDVGNQADLTEALSRPYEEDVALARRLDDDVMVLGAGGKMGPTLVRRICRAFDAAGSARRVYAVSRFSDAENLEEVKDAGAEVIEADLMDDDELNGLPDCNNIIYLVGMKFGAAGRQPLTWALNAYLPGRVANRFGASRIVALSTGNVYPQVPIDSGGATEDVDPAPVGEYAQSCLGRERVFEYFAAERGTPTCLIRLNYAVEARYGVLLDIATSVAAGKPVSLEMGYVNVIWQGDANSVCFRALEACTTPASVLNVTGSETLAVRDIAAAFGERLGVEPSFVGTEGAKAFLSDAARCHDRFGPPRVPVGDVIDLVAKWITRGGPTHGKPTKFQVSDGRF